MIRGKVCVVTGASSGIGEATARTLAGAGATVVLAARRTDRLEKIAAEITAEGGTASWQATDVTHLEDLETLRSHVEEMHGRCHVLVNNAGLPGRGRFEELSLERILAVTETNYVALLTSTKMFLPLLLASSGHAVNIASLAGRYALPGASVYAASKHAVVAFSESLSGELRDRGVVVTAVCPGFVDTESFPQPNAPRAVMFTPEQVARRIVQVIDRREVGTVHIPPWAGPLSALQLLAPPMYRFLAKQGARRYARRDA
ncbi:MAG TPA: SDR family NAD(P)-dependent oxidoreductase [Actinomycetota bacterium]|nr:SDR family NAD(P)-dependent oxidoreductase [Actinomycetota bacterium]